MLNCVEKLPCLTDTWLFLSTLLTYDLELKTVKMLRTPISTHNLFYLNFWMKNAKFKIPWGCFGADFWNQFCRSIWDGDVILDLFFTHFMSTKYSSKNLWIFFLGLFLVISKSYFHTPFDSTPTSQAKLKFSKGPFMRSSTPGGRRKKCAWKLFRS